jgi:hypothetical protein
MPSARVHRPSRRGLLRSFAVAAAVAGSALLPGAVAAADEPGTTVVGQLVQAQPESGSYGDQAPVSWVETADGETVPVDTAGVDGVPAGSTVSLTVGDATTDETQQVLESEVLAAPETPAAPQGPLTNQVTVAMVTPAGAAAAPQASLQQVVDLVNGPVADFWAAETDGAVALGVTATADSITTTAGCGTPAQLWDEAAAKVGFEPGPGKHLLLYVPPGTPGCVYALAEIGAGLTSGGRLYVTDAAASVNAHELGHKFGLALSSGRLCEGAVDAGQCRTVGYRDYYDVMGVSWAEVGSLNVLQAAQLGVLPAAQVASVPVSAQPTTVTLAPVSAAAGTRALQLTDASGVDYWLEYRPAAERDAWLGSAANRFALDAGVLLRRTGAFPDTSLLLDGTPSPEEGWDGDLQDALAVGTPVTLAGGQFTVTLTSTSDAGAVLQVVPAAPPAPAEAASPAPAAPVPGTTLPAEGRTQETPAAQEPAPVEQPAAAPAPERGAVSGAPVPAQPALAASSEPTGSSAVLLLTGAATALAGATTLVVRKLRRPVRR